jgi:iron complex transport system ATP-binding protein
VTILQVQDVGIRYSAQWVLKDISFDVGKGEIIGIIGPNGSGKTTLLKLLDGILFPQEGDVRIQGTSIRRIKRQVLARLVAVVPQETYMIFPFRVAEVVLMGRSPHLGRLVFEGKRDYQIAINAMEKTDIISFADRKVHQLSGGERQRVWIARALAQEPQIILLDESTAFLDIRHQVGFFELIKSINKQEGLTVIVVTHDINLAAQYVDRIILLREGKIYEMGEPEKVITESNIAHIYETGVLVDKNPVSGRPRVTLLGSHPPEGGSRLKSGAAPQL